MFIYIIFLSWNVEHYKQGNYSRIDKECISKVKFDSKKEKNSFIKGLEFAGWTAGVEFQLISEGDYSMLL